MEEALKRILIMMTIMMPNKKLNNKNDNEDANEDDDCSRGDLFERRDGERT